MARGRSLVVGLALVAALVAACSDPYAPPSTPPSSPATSPSASGSAASDPRGILSRYGWTPTGEPRVSAIPLPAAEDMGPGGGQANFVHYLAASREVGLDFTRFAGRTLDLQTFELARDEAQGRIVRAHLLVAEGQVVGGWLSVEPEAPGIYPLDTPREELLR